jgi:histidinol-phosphatase
MSIGQAGLYRDREAVIKPVLAPRDRRGWFDPPAAESYAAESVDDDLAFALYLADVADSISLPRFRSVDLVVETKPDLTPVTEVDRAVETAIRDRIAEGRPRDVVVGEEFGGSESEAEEGAGRWIVDPIDGTKNYVRGIPVWATLVAMERDGHIVASVVSAPALGRRWWGTRGRGAFAAAAGSGGDERRIAVSRVERLEDAQVMFGGLKAWKKSGMVEGLMDLVLRSWRARGFGDFWMHMLVAEGAAEVATEPEVSLWDLAAVKLIVEEAGGRFTDLRGRATPSGGSALSTNGLLHEEARRILVGD